MDQVESQKVKEDIIGCLDKALSRYGMNGDVIANLH